MPVNSKKKGAAYEREVKDKFIRAGFQEAHRSAQYCGNTGDAADVVGVEYLHIECKRQEVYKIDDWIAQAEFDARNTEDIPVLIFRKSNQPTYVLMRLEGKNNAKGKRIDGFLDIYREYFMSRKEKENES